jgi:hypothetical protein
MRRGVNGSTDRERRESTPTEPIPAASVNGRSGGHNPPLPSAEPSTRYEFKLGLEAIAAALV